jgi:hypothetical protein
MSVESSKRALLDLVEAYRARECAAVLDKARAGAAATLAQAHAEARASVRRSFAEVRERRSARIASARAELATRHRLADQHRLSTLLAEAWPLLAEELARRWREPELRRRWVEHTVALARSLLPPGPWRIAYAPDWPQSERNALAATLSGPPTFVPESAHRAGLAVASSANVIDDTLEGLLADRAEVGAQLLSELQRAQAPAEAAQ